ncbi:hypothetical protein Clacol_005634 [Clathrus columnatus]|uniref:Uncharacterized protein n=1 Tax=Clathrus columnatus TaxID=1419009 RepID=A0AAV5A9V7_9AGAM|nr:hypothetical protein Clacol_005634 [Clathrus columnatus]
MTRRHHRKLSFYRRQRLPLLSSNTESPPSDNTGSTSSSGTTQSDPATGNANTSQEGESGNGANNSNGLPIGAPQDPNPPPFTPTFTPSATSSNAIPSIDPSPPKGAQQQPVLSAASSSSSSALVTSPGLNSATTTTSSASSAISNTPMAIVSPTSSSSTAIVQTPVVLPTSNSIPFGAPNTAPTSLVPHPTINGSLPAPTNTSSAAPSSSISTPAIVGIAAGSLCGLAILGAACLWIGKRVSRYLETKELEPPPMHEPVPDDDDASAILSRRPSGPSSTPRPPTMIERKQANLAGRGNGFYNNGFPPQPGFPQYTDPRFANAIPGVPPFAPGQYHPNQAVNASPVQPYFNPIATPSPFDDSAAASTPGTPVYFSRQNSMQSGFAPPPNEVSQPQLPNPYDTPVARPNDGYATLNRGPGSVSPQQARQYSDLARQLDFSSTSVRTTSPAPSAAGSYATVPLISNNTGVPTSPKSPSFKAVPRSPSVVNVSTEVHEGRATPVQFGFNDPSSATSPVQANSQPPHIQPTHAQPVRPETIYDEEDAYAAI